MEERSSPAEFRDIPKVYLIKEEDGVVKGFRNRKELREVFENNNKTVNTFIKEKKIKYNKPEDLKSLLVYYEGL